MKLLCRQGARHNVYAYVLNSGAIRRYSDDGEPQGSAGMPVLDVIRKRECTNVAIVVTRYFGGTLLGTGGLVRAYTSAAAGAISLADIVTYDLFTTVDILCSYSDYQKIGSVLSEYSFSISNTRYTDSVTVSGKILSRILDALADKLIQISGGRIKCEILGENFDFIKK